MNHLNFVRLYQCSSSTNSRSTNSRSLSSLRPLNLNLVSTDLETVSSTCGATNRTSEKPSTNHFFHRSYCRNCRGIRYFSSRGEKETANQRLLQKLFRNSPSSRSEFMNSQQKTPSSDPNRLEAPEEDPLNSVDTLDLNPEDLTATEVMHPDLRLYNRLHGIEDEERRDERIMQELADRGENVSEAEFLQKLDPHGYTRQILDVLPLLFPDKEIIKGMRNLGLTPDEALKYEDIDKEDEEEFEEAMEDTKIQLQDEEGEGMEEGDGSESTPSGTDGETPTEFRKRWESRLNLSTKSPQGQDETAGEEEEEEEEEQEEESDKQVKELDPFDPQSEPSKPEEDEEDEFVFPHDYPGGEGVSEFLAEREVHKEGIDPKFKREPHSKSTSQYDLPKEKWGLVNARDNLETWLGRDESDLWRYAFASEKEVEEQLWSDLNIPKANGWKYSPLDEELDDHFRARAMALWDKEGHPSVPTYIPNWVKEEIYHLYNEDPVDFDIDSLALAYQIPTGVIAGILLGKGRERKMAALGHKPTTAVETWLKIYLNSRQDSRVLFPQFRDYSKVEQAKLAPRTMDFQDPEVPNTDYFLGFEKKNKSSEQDPLITKSKKAKKQKTRFRDFPKHVPITDSLGDDLTFVELPDKAEREFRSHDKAFYLDLNKRYRDDIPILVWNYGRIRQANHLERVFCLKIHGKNRVGLKGVPVPYRKDLVPVTQDILNIDANSLGYLYEDVNVVKIQKHEENDEPTFDLSAFAELRSEGPYAEPPDIMGNPHLQDGKMVPGTQPGLDLFHPNFLDDNREIEFIAPMSLEQQKLAELLRAQGRQSSKPKESDQKVQFHELIEHYKHILSTKQQDTQAPGRTPVNPFSIRSSEMGTSAQSGAPQFDFKALIDSIGNKSG